MSLICSYGFIRSRWHPGSCLEHRNFLVRLLRVPFFEMCSLLLFPLGGLPLWDLATIPVALLGCISLSHPSLLSTILHSSCYSFTSRKISGWWYLTGGRAFFIFFPQDTQSVAVSETNVRKAYKGHECSGLPLIFLTDAWPHASKKGRGRETDKEAGVAGRVGRGSKQT